MDQRTHSWPDTEPDVVEMDRLLLRLMRGINGQVFRALGNRVLTGPFRGMMVAERTPHWDDGNSGTKLIGCYEHELHEDIETAIERKPKIIINIGCGEGFYAVGLAARCRDATSYALDTSPHARAMCANYAAMNGVQVQIVDGATSPEQIRFQGLAGNRLYIMDCEGTEDELLDPEKCPELATSDIIVECHEFLKKDVSRRITERLQLTHQVKLVKPRLPDFDQFPFLGNSPTVMTLLVVTEKRPMPCYWLTCWANSRGEADG